jgi:hypothetical protein
VNRRLSLKTERLAELTTDELHSVAGAQQAITIGGCPSLLLNCPSQNICSTVESCGCSPTYNCQ